MLHILQKDGGDLVFVWNPLQSICACPFELHSSPKLHAGHHLVISVGFVLKPLQQFPMFCNNNNNNNMSSKREVSCHRGLLRIVAEDRKK